MAASKWKKESGDSPGAVTTGFISALVFLALSAVTNAATMTSVTSPVSTTSSTTTSTALITPGTDCADSEALFNCLTTSWQQCASGQWSIGIAIEGQGSDGLICSPSGLSYDMKIVYANGTAAEGDPGSSSGLGEGDSTGTATGTGGRSGEGGQGTTATATATATTPGSSIAGGSLQNSGASTMVFPGWWKSETGRWLGAALVASAFMSF